MPEEKVRTVVGIWTELQSDEQWRHQGVFRVIAFLMEASDEYTFRLPAFSSAAEQIREDLRTLPLLEGHDWIVDVLPEDEEAQWLSDPLLQSFSENVRRVAALAALANNLPVQRWLVTFPHYVGATLLTEPFAVLFPDAIPFDFPLGWLGEGEWGRDGAWPRWRARAAHVLAAAQTVITFSDHVRHGQLKELFDLPDGRATTVPLAPPDLGELLPFVEARRRTTESRKHAADIIRAHAESRSILYLRDFPFDEINYLVSATQDRPTKNLGLAADYTLRSLKKRQNDAKVFMTAPIASGADWARLPASLERHLLHRDVVSFPDLPRPVHAALLHCAIAAVHFSFFEGIVGALPAFEAISVGTPAVVADGPHVAELLELSPEYARYIFDPYDVRSLERVLDDVAKDREVAIDLQLAAYERMQIQTWPDVARAYARAATARPADAATSQTSCNRGEATMNDTGSALNAIFPIVVRRQLAQKHQAEALALLAEQRLADAEHAARAALELDGENVAHCNLLAEILEELGRRGEAISILEDGVRSGVRNGQTYSLLGNFWLRDRDLERAEIAFFEGTLIDRERDDIAACLAAVRRERAEQIN